MSSIVSKTQALTGAAHLAHLRACIEAALVEVVPNRTPDALYGSAAYVLAGGGKRLRPILTLLAAESVGGTVEQALPAAVGVEVFHNFTLVHDDIMDHADTRRGRATVHQKWNENTAILSGDLLFSLAMHALAQLKTDRLAEVMHLFHEMVMRLCEGQQLDMQFETQAQVEVADYLDMIARKTGALLVFALDVGGMLGGATVEQRTTLKQIGFDVGRAFQIQDDLLDLTAESPKWGKPIGGDLVEGKKAYLLLHALEVTEGEERAWFARILDQNGLPPEAIPEARNRMARAGVLADAQTLIEQHYNRAENRLATLPDTPARTTLLGLVGQLKNRRY